MAQCYVEHLPAVQETWVQSLDWEDLLEMGMTTHSNNLAWRIPMDRGAWRATVHGIAKSWIWLKQLSMHACRNSRTCWGRVGPNPV